MRPEAAIHDEAAARERAGRVTSTPANRSGARRAVLAAVAATLVARLVFLFWTGFAIESDESVMGLAALHLGRLRELPVWFYGQEYMGALEAYVGAPLVMLVGGPVALKLTALCFALVFAGAAAAFARQVFGPGRAAFFTVAWLVVAPLMLTLWSLKLRGVIPVLALGQLVLLLAHRQGTSRPSVAGAALMGLLAGLGVWLNLLILPFLAAAGLFLLVRPRFWGHLGAVAAALAGLAVGAAPFWVYQLRHGAATLHFLLDGKGNLEVRQHLTNTFGVHLPTLLGALPPWREGPVPLWGWGLVGVFAAAAAALVWRARRGLAALVLPRLRPTDGAELYVLTALGYLAAALFSRFGAEPEPRYAVVLYVFLAPAIGLLLGTLWDAGRRPRALAAVLACGVFAVSLGSTFGVDRHLPTQPLFCVRDGTLTPLDQSELYRVLEAEGIDALYTEYWMGYRIIYETAEKVVTVPGRYGPYAERVRAAQRRAWLYRDGGWPLTQYRALLRELDALGLTYQDRRVQGYRLVIPGELGLPRQGWTARASRGPDAGAVLDGDFNSRWSTGALQRPGEWLEIDLGEARALDAVAVAFSSGDAPAAARVELAGEDGAWERLVERDRPPEQWRIALEGRTVRRLRLTQLGQSANRWWSVDEVFAFGR